MKVVTSPGAMEKLFQLMMTWLELWLMFTMPEAGELMVAWPAMTCPPAGSAPAVPTAQGFRRERTTRRQYWLVFIRPSFLFSKDVFRLITLFKKNGLKYCTAGGARTPQILDGHD